MCHGALRKGRLEKKGGGAYFPGEAPGPDAEQNLVFGATDCHLLFRLEWGNVSTDMDRFRKMGNEFARV